MQVLRLHGIHHNLFGKRDPKQYGTTTRVQIDAQLTALGQELGVQVESFRHHSAFAEIMQGQVAGFGVDSYLIGLCTAVRHGLLHLSKKASSWFAVPRA